MPRSASTLVTVPPPAPEPMTTTSWTVEVEGTCAMCCLRTGRGSLVRRTGRSRAESMALCGGVQPRLSPDYRVASGCRFDGAGRGCVRRGPGDGVVGRSFGATDLSEEIRPRGRRIRLTSAKKTTTRASGAPAARPRVETPQACRLLRRQTQAGHLVELAADPFDDILKFHCQAFLELLLPGGGRRRG